MTSRERLLTVLRGGLPDRVPVYTLIPFALEGERFVPGPFHGYEDWDDWRARDPGYRELVERMERECDNFFVWRPECLLPDHILVPPAAVRETTAVRPDGTVEIGSHVSIGGRELSRLEVVKPGTGHTWEVEHLCKEAEDARALLDLPSDDAPHGVQTFEDLQSRLGDRGLMWVTVPSPLLVVCRLFDPTEFLIALRTERELVGRLMAEAQSRITRRLGALLDRGVGPVIRFGGAEHATPPLASPEDFDWLVVEHDAPPVRMCRERGLLTAVHCHGNLRHALERFVQIGVDQTDPVEAEPDGDLTLGEARRIAGDRLTLTGNIQMKELVSLGPEGIERRVRTIIEQAGPRRLIVSTTATPLEPMDPALVRNYHAMIDAVLRWGKVG